jgi:hypothetical protein
MKLLIVGSRCIEEFDLTGYVPCDVELIISGGARGIDTIAEQYADSHGIQKLIFYPEYEKYGRAAPLRRNEKMVDISEVILAIWDGESKGTKYTLNYAKKKNKKIIEIVVDNEK